MVVCPNTTSVITRFITFSSLLFFPSQEIQHDEYDEEIVIDAKQGLEGPISEPQDPKAPPATKYAVSPSVKSPGGITALSYTPRESQNVFYQNNAFQPEVQISTGNGVEKPPPYQ